jgi:hypothetical protein
VLQPRVSAGACAPSSQQPSLSPAASSPSKGIRRGGARYRIPVRGSILRASFPRGILWA